MIDWQKVRENWSLVEKSILTSDSAQHSSPLKFILLFLQIFMDVPPNSYLLFLVIFDNCFEVGFFAQSVFVYLLIDCSGEIIFLLLFWFLFYTAGVKRFEGQIVQFTLKIGSFFDVIINVEIDGNLSNEKVTLYIWDRIWMSSRVYSYSSFI